MFRAHAFNAKLLQTPSAVCQTQVLKLQCCKRLMNCRPRFNFNPSCQVWRLMWALNLLQLLTYLEYASDFLLPSNLRLEPACGNSLKRMSHKLVGSLTYVIIHIYIHIETKRAHNLKTSTCRSLIKAPMSSADSTVRIPHPEIERKFASLHQSQNSAHFSAQKPQDFHTSTPDAQHGLAKTAPLNIAVDPLEIMCVIGFESPYSSNNGKLQTPSHGKLHALPLILKRYIFKTNP